MKKIVLLLLLVLFALMEVNFAQMPGITVEDIWKKHAFYPRGVTGFKSLQDGDYYTVLSDTGIIKYSFETGEKEAVLLSKDSILKKNGGRFNMKDINNYQFDAEEKQVLLAVNTEMIYRRSNKAFYYLYDCENGTLQPLADTASGKQSFATFSQDGKKIAFVRNNNIFVYDREAGGEMQITYDGLENTIKNGIADWVYEEELGLSRCFEWSPDGAKIAYWRFDESHVKQYTITRYGELYPWGDSFKYPKAGEENSLVNIQIFDFNTLKKTELKLGDGRNNYIPRIFWLSNSVELMVLQLNRLQNKLDFYRYNTNTREQNIVFSDTDNCWVDIRDYHVLDDNKTMILTSERDGYNHIYKVEFGGKTTQLTHGEWEVASVSAVDSKNRTIYYLSNESGVLNRDLYEINFNGKKKKMLSNGQGWNSVQFSSNARYYMNTYSDIQTPPLYTLHDQKGTQLRVLQDNAVLKRKMRFYRFLPKEFFSFTTESGILLNGWMIKPRDMKEHEKYPVLMYVYGGPGSQEVSNAFSKNPDFAWYQMLADQGYIIVTVDGRGTAARGAGFKKAIYKQMGRLESEDQMAAARYLKTLPYVDPDRIGIWGWSFGGYLSSLSMFKGEGLFKMAIAVAPVTNWRYYDNIYTERFLRTPRENPSGYDDNSPVTHAAKMKGNYLLIHGTADDNVHVQNAIDLSTALIKEEKQFDHFFYPNMNHSLNGGTARYHLYTKLTQFILQNL